MENIEAIYPVGRLDKSLLVVGGNKTMYEFIGKNIYSPLYKMVPEKDVDRLKNAVSRCNLQSGTQAEDVEECLHFINEQGRYDTYLVALRRTRDFDGYEIELQNVSENIRRIERISSRLGMMQDYLTLSGNALLSYQPADDERRAGADIHLSRKHTGLGEKRGYLPGENSAQNVCRSEKGTGRMGGCR